MDAVDKFVDRRNELQLRAENMGEGERCWLRLGVANRHIQRLYDGVFPLSPAVQREIEQCFERVDSWLNGGQD